MTMFVKKKENEIKRQENDWKKMLVTYTRDKCTIYK